MPEGFKEKVDELAGHMFNMMWNLTQMDIESTLGEYFLSYEVIRLSQIDIGMTSYCVFLTFMIPSIIITVCTVATATA